MTDELFNVAAEAITEAVHLLHFLAMETGRNWDNSVPIANLDRLARRLGYPDAQAVAADVETEEYRSIHDEAIWG